MKLPRVSVVMPVYNGERYIRQAIDSVLAQTFKDFELVVINDGSTDRSVDEVKSYADPRIRLIQNDCNLGLARVRNIGLAEARGEFIAWLDCDDISAPTRLEEQIGVLARHPDVGLCGTWVRTIGKLRDDEWRYPTQSDVLKARMLFDDPIATSSCMVRRELLLRSGLEFDEDLPPAEDYGLWEQVSRRAELTVIPHILTYWRVHSAQTSVRLTAKAEAAVWRIQERQLSRLKIVPTEEEKELHLNIGVRYQFRGTPAFVRLCGDWLQKLVDSNSRQRIYPDGAFRNVAAERWYSVCRAATGYGFYAWREFWRQPLSADWDMPITRRAKFLFLCGTRTGL